jgi:putative oxidoreductase
MSKGTKIALWIMSILLAAMFLLSGSPKLLTPEKVKPMFVQYGYAPWFATFIGICEVLGAIGLLVPRVAAFAAAGLSVIMVGAFFTHATHHELSHAMIPLVLLALLITVGYARFREARALPRD